MFGKLGKLIAFTLGIDTFESGYYAGLKKAKNLIEREIKKAEKCKKE